MATHSDQNHSLLAIGFPEEVAAQIAEAAGDTSQHFVSSYSEALPQVEQRTPALVLLYRDSSDLEAEAMRRIVAGEAQIFLVAETPFSEPPAEVDDYFELPREAARFDFRIRHALEQASREFARRQRANELADKLQRYELAFHGSDDALWDAKVYWPDWFDDENRVYYSARFKSMLGFEEDELDNRLGAWKQRVHPDDQMKVYQAFDAHLHRHEPFDIEYRMFNKRGEIVWIRGVGSAVWDFNDIPERMAGTNRDITARKIAEDERDKFFKHSLDLLCYANIEGYFVRVNPACCRVLGYSEEELLSRPFLELVHPDDLERTLKEIENLKSGRDTIHFKNRYIRKDGSICWLSWRTPAPLPGEDTLFAIARDITDEKEALLALEREQELLKQMIQDQERDRKLIACEIHDGLVQQMTAAIMHLETFQSARESDAERAERNLKQAMGLLPEAVEEARRVIGGLRPPVLDDLGIVAGIAYLSEEASRQIDEVLFDPDDDLPALPNPLEDTLFRIAQESLNNAVQHSRSSRIEVRLSHEPGWLTLTVQDWGIGFDPADHPPGHFGLSGMRERCRLMDCELSIESTLGEGTIVTCRFPLPEERHVS